jgi:hypothetical protein
MLFKEAVKRCLCIIAFLISVNGHIFMTIYFLDRENPIYHVFHVNASYHLPQAVPLRLGCSVYRARIALASASSSVSAFICFSI